MYPVDGLNKRNVVAVAALNSTSRAFPTNSFTRGKQKKRGTLGVPINMEELGFLERRGTRFIPSSEVRVMFHHTLGAIGPDRLIDSCRSVWF